MSQQIEEIFSKYKKKFRGKEDEIKEFLLSYYEKIFKMQVLMNVERIDATKRIETDGFVENLSSWQNSYKNIIVSSCDVINGVQKRYDYKFFFIEERLDETTVEKIENALELSSRLRLNLKFDEALEKIDEMFPIVQKKKDVYFEKILNDAKKEIISAQKKHDKGIEQIEKLEDKIKINRKYEGNLKDEEDFRDKDTFLGIEKYKKKIEKYKKTDDYDRFLELLKILSEYCISTKNYILAEKYAEELYNLSIKQDNLFYRGESNYLIGYLMLKKGENQLLEEALKRIQNASIDYENSGDYAGAGACYNKIGEIYQTKLNHPFNAALFHVQAIRSFNEAILKPNPLRKDPWSMPFSLSKKIIEIKDQVEILITRIKKKSQQKNIIKDLKSIKFFKDEEIEGLEIYGYLKKGYDLSGTNAGIEAFSKQFLEGAYRFINLDAPLYIRIISLLLRIIIDRYGIAKYDNLPPLPINLYKEPEFHMVGPVNHTIHRYIDKITNNASLEIKEFFIEAIGLDTKGPIKPCLNQNILLPIPFFLISDYLDYGAKIRKKFSKTLSTKDYIDHTPIRVRDNDGRELSSNMILYSQGSVDYISKYNFSKLIVAIAEFIKKIYLKLSISNTQREEVQNICDFFFHFFQPGRYGPTKPIKIINTILETELLLKDIDEEILHKFTYNPRETEKSLAEPFQVKELFSFSLDLFNKPFLRDPYGAVILSTLWLFDSLFSKLTWFLREKIIGSKRGIKVSYA